MAPVLTHRSVPACSFHATAFTVDSLPRMAHCTVTLGLQMAGCIQPCCFVGLPLRRGSRFWLRCFQGSAVFLAALVDFQDLIRPASSERSNEVSWTSRIVPISLQHLFLVWEKISESLMFAVHKGFRRFQDRSCGATNNCQASILALQSCA